MCVYLYKYDTHPYIYIVIHRQTVSFYQNSSVWLDTQDALSRDPNPSNFKLDLISDRSATKRTTLAKRIFKVFTLATAAAAFVYIFYTLSTTRVLNSFEELVPYASGGRQFLRQSAQPHVCICIYIYIYIYTHTFIYIYIYMYIYI